MALRAEYRFDGQPNLHNNCKIFSHESFGQHHHPLSPSRIVRLNIWWVTPFVLSIGCPIGPVRVLSRWVNSLDVNPIAIHRCYSGRVTR